MTITDFYLWALEKNIEDYEMTVDIGLPDVEYSPSLTPQRIVVRAESGKIII